MGIWIGPDKKGGAGTKVQDTPLSKQRRKLVTKTKPLNGNQNSEEKAASHKMKGKFFFSEDTSNIKNSEILDLSKCGYNGDQAIRGKEGFVVDKIGYVDLEICLNLKGQGLFHSDILILNDEDIVSIIPFDGKGICQLYTKQTLFFEKGYVNFRIKTKGEKIKVLGIQTGFYSQIGIEFS